MKQQDENDDEENESEEEKESEDEEEPIEEGDTMEEDENDGKVTEKFFRKQLEINFYAKPLTLLPSVSFWSPWKHQKTKDFLMLLKRTLERKESSTNVPPSRHHLNQLRVPVREKRWPLMGQFFLI